MRTPIRYLSILSIMALAAVTSSAGPFGSDITIPDNNNNGSNPAVAGNWYSNREDNETETNPNTINAQVWDVEAMYLNGTKLTLVGGFDFKNGTNHANRIWRGGDLFIDQGANSAVYGQAANGNSGTTEYSNIQPINTANAFGYDFVLDIGAFNGSTFAFDVVQLSAASIVSRVADVASSNPWTYVSGGTVLGSSTGNYGVLNAGEVSALGLLGDVGGNNTHYYLTVDLASVPGLSGSSLFHYTMECGNDNLVGQASVPDSGSTAILLGGALLGFAGVRRLRLKRSA